MGITAKRTEAMSATHIPYLRSAILKIKNVSIIARMPISNLGTI
jgi:hypothetical protein